MSWTERVSAAAPAPATTARRVSLAAKWRVRSSKRSASILASPACGRPHGRPILPIVVGDELGIVAREPFNRLGKGGGLRPQCRRGRRVSVARWTTERGTPSTNVGTGVRRRRASGVNGAAVTCGGGSWTSGCGKTGSPAVEGDDAAARRIASTTAVMAAAASRSRVERVTSATKTLTRSRPTPRLAASRSARLIARSVRVADAAFGSTAMTGATGLSVTRLSGAVRRSQTSATPPRWRPPRRLDGRWFVTRISGHGTWAMAAPCPP